MIKHIWAQPENRIFVEGFVCEVCGIEKIASFDWENGKIDYFKPNHDHLLDDDPGCIPSLIHLAKAYQEAKHG